MPDYEPKKNDYVTYNAAGDYGVIKSVDGSAKTAVVKDKHGAEQTDIAFADITQSAMARMTLKAGPNVIELLENIAGVTLYNVLMKRGYAGPENLSFALSDALYEFLLKPFVADWIDMSRSPVLEENQDAFIQTSDFTEPIRKLPQLVVLQQILQKVIWKKNFGHGIMHNIAGGYAGLTVTNIADRMFSADTGKPFRYT